MSSLKLWPLPTAMSEDGLAQVRGREGCRLVAYQDIGGKWTIGYGRAYAVYKGDVITQVQADHFLAIDITASCVAINREVHSPLSQNMYDALGSFIFNIGVGPWLRSDVLTAVNAADYARAANYMLGWCHVNGHYSQPLYNRRKSEARQFAA